MVSLEEALAQEEKIKIASTEYRPVLDKVRRIESKINRKLREIKELKKEQVLQKTLKDEESVEMIDRDIGEVQIEIDKLKGKIPSDWVERYESFSVLMKEEQKLRNMYRRSGDSSYQEIKGLSIN